MSRVQGLGGLFWGVWAGQCRLQGYYAGLGFRVSGSDIWERSFALESYFCATVFPMHGWLGERSRAGWSVREPFELGGFAHTGTRRSVQPCFRSRNSGDPIVKPPNPEPPWPPLLRRRGHVVLVRCGGGGGWRS